MAACLEYLHSRAVPRYLVPAGTECAVFAQPGSSGPLQQQFLVRNITGAAVVRLTNCPLARNLPNHKQHQQLESTFTLDYQNECTTTEQFVDCIKTSTVTLLWSFHFSLHQFLRGCTISPAMIEISRLELCWGRVACNGEVSLGDKTLNMVIN